MLIGENLQVATEGWGNGHGKAVMHPKPSGAHWGAACALGFASSLFLSPSHPAEQDGPCLTPLFGLLQPRAAHRILR